VITYSVHFSGLPGNVTCFVCTKIRFYQNGTLCLDTPTTLSSCADQTRVILVPAVQLSRLDGYFLESKNITLAARFRHRPVSHLPSIPPVPSFQSAEYSASPVFPIMCFEASPCYRHAFNRHLYSLGCGALWNLHAVHGIMGVCIRTWEVILFP
jgi:hypothetical protein